MTQALNHINISNSSGPNTNPLMNEPIGGGNDVNEIHIQQPAGRPVAPQGNGLAHANGVPVQVPVDINGQGYLQHCSNGLKGLCERYHIQGSQGNVRIQEQNDGWRSAMHKMCVLLGFAEAASTAEGAEGELSGGGNQHVSDFKTRVRNRLGEQGIDVDSVTDEILSKALKFVLGSDSLQESLAFEKTSGNYRTPDEFAENISEGIFAGEGLKSSVKAMLLKHIEERLVSVLSRPGGLELTDVELSLAVDGKDYDMNSPKDMLELFNRASVRLVKQAPVELKAHFERFLAPGCLLDLHDGHDEQMTKLAVNKRLLQSVRSDLNRILSGGTVHADYVRSSLEVLNHFETQMLAVAKQGLEKKIRDAQATQVRHLYEQGSSTSAEIKIEVGPEFSLLNDRLTIGGKFSFTYSYSISVSHPYGRITVSNKLSPSLFASAGIGQEDDAITGTVSGGGKYAYTHSSIYMTPEELLEAESGSLLKKLLHYAKPLEVPKSDESGFWGGLKALGRNILGGVKTVGYGLVSLHHYLHGKTPEQLARQAMRENESFKAMLHRQGVLGQFDVFSRKSINKKSGIQKSKHSVGGFGKGEVSFSKLPALKGGSLSISGSRDWTSLRSYKGLLTHLGSSKMKLQEYLAREYENVGDDSPALLRQEKEQFRNHQPSNASELLSALAQLEGEFKTYCQETNRDDSKRHIFRSPRSLRRGEMMAARGAEDRGEYIRALMTRYAALKLSLMSMAPRPETQDAEIMTACGHLLERLGKELEAPPIRLSSTNQKALEYKTERKSVSSNIDITLKSTFHPIPVPDLVLGGSASDIEVSSNLNIVVPHGTQGFYRSHNKASFSISVTGNQLVQYGPQIIGNAITSIQQYLAKKSGGEGEASGVGAFLHSLSETLNDVAANLAGDFGSNKLNELVANEIKKHTIVAAGEEIGLDEILQFKVSNNNTFTVTLNFTGTGEGGVRYGGISISNTRTHSIGVKAGVPLTSSVNIAGNVGLSLSSTSTVLMTLGTDTFQPLCDAMAEIKESSKGREAFALNHDKALRELSSTCFQADTKLNNELKAYLNKVTETCVSVTQDLRNSHLKVGATIDKAQKMLQLSLGLLKTMRSMEGSDAFYDSQDVRELKSAIGHMMSAVLQREGKSVDEAVDIVWAMMESLEDIQPAESYSAESIMTFGYFLKQLDMSM